MGIQLDFVTIWTKMKQKSEKSGIRNKHRSFDDIIILRALQDDESVI